METTNQSVSTLVPAAAGERIIAHDTTELVFSEEGRYTYELNGSEMHLIHDTWLNRYTLIIF